MQLEQRRQAVLQQHMSDRQFYCLLRCDLYYRFYGSNTTAFIHSIAILTISLDSFYINSHLFISMYHTDLENPIEHATSYLHVRHMGDITGTKP